MAELDLNQPLPDRAHDAIRRAVLQAIADGAWNTTSSDMAFDLIDTLFQMLGQTQDAVAALEEWRALTAAPTTPSP